MSILVGVSPQVIGSVPHIEAIHREVDFSGLSASDIAAATNRIGGADATNRIGGADASEDGKRQTGVFGIRLPWQVTPPPASSGAGTTSETPASDERNVFQRAFDAIRIPTSISDFTGSMQTATSGINPASPVTLAIPAAAALGAYMVFRK